MVATEGTRLPRVIFLDVGWTLLHPRQSMWEIFAAVGREAGADLSAINSERMVYELVRSLRTHAMAELENGARYSDSDQEFAAQFDAIGRLVFTAGGITSDPACLIKRFLDRFWNGENWLVFPDVIGTLDRLRGLGIRLGVLSNAASTLLDFLDYHRLLSRFDFTVVSAVEGMKKPDRRIFEIALRRAGSHPAETLHVGDMYIEDILGAQRAGIRPFLIDRGRHAMFPNHPEPEHTLPDGVRVVRSLREILTTVEEE